MVTTVPMTTRTSAEARTPLPVVGARTAYVLADPDMWPSALETALHGLGLNVTTATELHELFDACRSDAASLLILAKPNPRFAVRACRAMRGLQGVPIFVVIPREADLISVLDAGADDTVVARVDPAIFAARVRALLRRVQHSGRSGGVFAVRDLEIDLDSCQVTLAGRVVPLTPTEFRILTVLADRMGRVVDARALLAAVHQHDYSERDAQNLVKVHIANLRRKLNDSGSQNPYILCVRGFGYMLERRWEPRPGDPLAELIESDGPSS